MKTEDVVDEEQHVLVLDVAEILRHGQAGQCHAHTGSWGLVHLAVDQRRLIDDAALGHFTVKVVALTGALTDTGEHRVAVVLGGNVIDQLLDQDGLADTGAAEQADLAALGVGADEVNDLDAGLQNLGGGLLLLIAGSGAVDGPVSLRGGAGLLSTGSPSRLNTRPRHWSPTGTLMDSPVSTASVPRTRPSVLLMAMQRATLSPVSCATSTTSFWPWLSISMALSRSGSSPSLNWMSSTGPMTWITLPMCFSDIGYNSFFDRF